MKINGQLTASKQSLHHIKDRRYINRGAVKNPSDNKMASPIPLFSPEEEEKKSVSNFHILVQNIVQMFARQRQGGYEFGVLFLSSEEHFETHPYVEFSTATSQEPTDKNLPTFPPDWNICNYVIARPDQRGRDTIHTEEQLMDKLDLLMSRYKSSGLPPCKSIVLYTWLLPCSQCTQRIIATLVSHILEERYKVILIYTSKMRDVSAMEAGRIVGDLRMAGITVIQEAYDERVQPIRTRR